MSKKIKHVPTDILFQRIIDSCKPIDFPVELSPKGYKILEGLVCKTAASIGIYLSFQPLYGEYGLTHQKYMRLLPKEQFEDMILKCIDKMEVPILEPTTEVNNN